MMNQKRLRRSGMTALAAAIAAASGQASAATFEVTNTNADGDGSLAAAIVDANAMPGDDTIDVLTSGTVNLAGTSLPGITGEVTIVGNGLRLEGGGQYAEATVLRVYQEASNSVISGLTITGAGQGAIEVRSGASGITLRDLQVSGSGSADSPASDDLISFNNASAYIENVTLRNNTLDADAPLYVYGGSTVDAVGLTISGNTMSDASAVEVDDSTLNVYDSFVTGNTNLGSGAGGLTFDEGSEGTLYNTEVAKNRGVLGGGVLVDGSELGVEYSSVTANYAEWSGGGIAADESALLLLESSVSGNRTSLADDGPYARYGGGIAAEDSLLLAYGASVTNNRSVRGGGLYAYGTALISKYSQFSNNQAVVGGGMFLQGDSEAPSECSPFSPEPEVACPRLISSAVSGNTAVGGEGGGKYAGNGGGIYAEGIYALFPKYSAITNNSATGSGGGVMITDAEGGFGLLGSKITGNTADAGGGMIVDGANAAFFKYADVSNNAASDFAGAGLVFAQQTYFKYSTVADNRSDAVPLLASSREIRVGSSTLSGNRSGEGPAIALFGYSKYGPPELGNPLVSISNSTVSGNVATGYPAAVSASAKYLDIGHSTFIDNVGAGEQRTQLHIAGKYEPASQAEVRDSVFASGNDVEVIAGGRSIEMSGGYESGPDVEVVLAANIMTNGFQAYGEGEVSNTFGAIPSDPMLGGLTLNGGFTKTHAPMPGSPVIDQGVQDRSSPDNRDQRGVEQDGPSDLGAVEYIATNTAPRLVKDFGGVLGGTVGRVIEGVSVLDAFVDDEGDAISLTEVSGFGPPVLVRGGVPGLEIDEEGIVSGELTTPGDYTVTIAVEDDGDPSLRTTVQAVVKVREPSAAPVFFIDDDDDDTLGSFPLALLSLSAAMGWLRRRRR